MRGIKKFFRPVTDNVVVGGIVSGVKNVAGAAKDAAHLASEGESRGLGS